MNSLFNKNYEKGTLEVKTKTGEYCRICELFEVDGITMPINGNPCDDVKYQVNGLSHHINQKFPITSSQLIETKEFMRLMYNHLFTFSSSFVEKIKYYINSEVIKCKEQGAVSYETGTLGWQTTPESDTRKFILQSGMINNKAIKYYDESLSFKKGTEEGQLDFIKTQIIPYQETRLAMTLGLASIVASYIEPYKHTGTLIFNVSGKTSTGKSTIAELSASFYGSPETSNYGLVRTFNATNNFIFALSEGRVGVPVILDDNNSNQNDHNKAQLVYLFAMSEPRGRCQNNGNAQTKRVGWSGLVLLTSESPLLDGVSNTQGANVRCITLDSIPWTRSAQHSESIKKGVRENYGFIAEKFADYIASLDIENVLEMHTKYTEEVRQMMIKTDGASDRIAKSLGVIVMTADLIKKFNPKFRIKVDEIKEMLVSAEQASIDDRSLSDNTFDLLVEYLTTNRSKLATVTKSNIYSNSCTVTYSPASAIGYVVYCGETTSEVCLLNKHFDAFLKENNIVERRTILKDWATKGIINFDKDKRYTKKAHRAGVVGRAISINGDKILDEFPYEDYYTNYLNGNAGD